MRDSLGPLIQRRCACGGIPGPEGECTACRAKRLARQSQVASSNKSFVAPPIVHEVLSSPGQPLDAATRASFEPRFGHDFSKVRVHTDANAAESALAVNARAYTVGHHMVFGAGQYAPNVAEGQKLLGHELVHTIQQDQIASTSSARCLPVGEAADSYESEATRAAEAVFSQPLDSKVALLALVSTHRLQRKVSPEISKIRGNLSYGLFDWAVTENEVHEVLTLLRPLSDEDLMGTLAALEPKFVDRIFSNVSKADAAGEAALLDRIGRLRPAPVVFIHSTELGGLSVGNFDFHFRNCAVLVWVWVKFKFTPDINPTEQAAFKTRFISAVHSVWGNSGYSLEGRSGCPCLTIPISIHVEENPRDYYHKLVDVERKTDPERRPKVISDINVNLFTDDLTLAHEFGHVLGLYDEYDGGFFENIMFWHKNQDDPKALMSTGTELRPRYFEQYRRAVEKTATGECKYQISSPIPPGP